MIPMMNLTEALRDTSVGRELSAEGRIEGKIEGKRGEIFGLEERIEELDEFHQKGILPKEIFQERRNVLARRLASTQAELQALQKRLHYPT